MKSKLLIFTITLLILATPAFGQWATQDFKMHGVDASMAYEDEPPIGMYVGLGSIDFKNFDAKSGFVYRWTGRLSTSLQANATYNEDAKKGDFGLGVVAFYFIGSKMDVFLSGAAIPQLSEGEKTDFETTKFGIGYMNRTGTIPFTDEKVGFPYIAHVTNDLTTGKWAVHFLMYFPF